MADPWTRARAARGFLLAVLLLLPAATLAGCISTPTTELTVRTGDLVRARVAVWNQTEVAFPPEAADLAPGCWRSTAEGQPASCTLAEQAFVVDRQRPATLPEGWQATQALPPGVVTVARGLAEGDTRHEQGVLAWGNRSEDLVETHPRTVWLPRVVDNATAYGRAWESSPAANGTVKIEPTDQDRGASLEVPRWCNERFCLFTSEVVGWNQTHLEVRHEAQAGQRVHVAELSTSLAVIQANRTQVVVDGNHPLAGQAFQVHVEVLEVRAPPQGQRRAPDFALTTLEGEPVSLESYLGQPLVLEFFASWCPSCRKNTEHLNRLQATYGDHVAILAIDVDPWETREQLQGFIQQNDVSWPIAVDTRGEVSQAYRVGSLSTEVLVNAQGIIVHTETGVADHERVSRILHGLIPADHHPEGTGEDHP